MAQRNVTVASKSGLHARPAAVFVQEAKRFQAAVTVAKDDKTVNAKSILSVLTLGAGQGDQVVLTAEGSDADDAVESLATLLERDLG
jgi:phosphotransferase system HPr (HPr) family protein